MSNRKHNQNSSDAFKSLDPNQIRQVYKDILFALGNLPDGGTYETIATVLKVKESRIWKRTGEMEQMGLIHRDGRKILSSGRYGSVWKIGKPGSTKSTEKAIPGKSVSDYAKKLIRQPTLF